MKVRLALLMTAVTFLFCFQYAPMFYQAYLGGSAPSGASINSKQSDPLFSSAYTQAEAVKNITVQQPENLAIDTENGYVYVLTNESVDVIDGSTNTVVKSITLQDGSLITYDPAQNEIFVSGFPSISSISFAGIAANGLPNATLPIYVIDTSSNSIVDTIKVVLPPIEATSLAVSNSLLFNTFNNMLYLFPQACSQTVASTCYNIVINPTTRAYQVFTLSLSVGPVTFDPSTGLMYGMVVSGLVTISTKTNAIVSDYSLLEQAQQYTPSCNIAFDQNNGLVYIGAMGQQLEPSVDVLGIDMSTQKIVQSLVVSYSSNSQIFGQCNSVGISNLYYNSATNIVYAGDAEANVIYAIDPNTSTVVQNISTFGISTSMGYNPQNGEIYSSNLFKAVTSSSAFSSTYSVPVNSVSAIFVGGTRAKGSLAIESVSYQEANSEVPSSSLTTLTGAFANLPFLVNLTVKNTGSNTVASPSSLLASEESPQKDSSGNAPVASSTLVGQPVNISPGQQATLTYQVTASWTFSSGFDEFISVLPALDSYTQSQPVQSGINSLLTQNNLAWYQKYADDNAQRMAQTVSMACPSVGISSSNINAPSQNDLNDASYGTVNSFASGNAILGVNYTVGFPGYTTSNPASVVVLMPPGKMVLLDCLLIYHLDSTSFFDKIHPAVEIGEYLYDALKGAEIATSLIDPSTALMAVLSQLPVLGTENLLISGIGDPSGNYTQTVSPPSRPTFLSNVGNTNVSNAIGNLYYYLGYLNASVSSSERAHEALDNNSLTFALSQTKTALSYANESETYFKAAIPEIESVLNQPIVSQDFNQTALQWARGNMTQMKLDPKTSTILSDLGLLHFYNASQFSNTTPFTPINGSIIQTLPNIATAFSINDQVGIINIEAAQSSQTAPARTSFTTSSSSLTTSTSSHSQVSANTPLILASTVIVAVVVLSVGMLIWNKRRTPDVKPDSK